MLIINIKLNYSMDIYPISLRGIEMISRMNSDHNRITSMSCLKKVIDTVETVCGKWFTNAVLWSDDMGTPFRSRFIFQLLAGTIFLNKSLCWYYNEGHHGKVSMDGEGKTIKNVARLWPIHPKNFLMLPWNLCHLLLLCTCLNWMKYLSLNASIRHHQSPKHFQSINLFDRSMIVFTMFTVVSRNMLLRLNLIFNLLSDGNDVFFILLI